MTRSTPGTGPGCCLQETAFPVGENRETEGPTPTHLSSAEHLTSGNRFQASFGDRGKPVDFGGSPQAPREGVLRNVPI